MWNFHYFFAYTLLERVPGRNAKDFLEGGCRFFFFFFFCFQGTINFSEHLQCCLKVPRSARSAVFIRAISGNKRDKEKKKTGKKKSRTQTIQPHPHVHVLGLGLYRQTPMYLTALEHHRAHCGPSRLPGGPSLWEAQYCGHITKAPTPLALGGGRGSRVSSQ